MEKLVGKRTKHLANYLAQMHQEYPELTDDEILVQINRDLEAITHFIRNASDDSINEFSQYVLDN